MVRSRSKSAEYAARTMQVMVSSAVLKSSVIRGSTCKAARYPFVGAGQRYSRKGCPVAVASVETIKMAESAASAAL